MRRIILSVAMLALVAVLASAGTVQADDEPGSQDLVIGLPPPCGDESAATLSVGRLRRGRTGRDSLAPIAPEIEAAAAETARVETALVASQGPEALRRNCRFHAEVSLYTDSDWNRLAQNLAAQASHCADYYISIPALTANKTMPRPRSGLANPRARTALPRDGRGPPDRMADLGDHQRTDVDGGRTGVPSSHGCGRLRRRGRAISGR